jgi:hypothetical protein
MTRAKLASTMIDELLISAPQVLRGANTWRSVFTDLLYERTELINKNS